MDTKLQTADSHRLTAAFNKTAIFSKAEYFSTVQQQKARVVPSSHFDVTRVVFTDYRELKLRCCGVFQRHNMHKNFYENL